MTDGPHHGQGPAGPAAQAADPSTSQVQLHRLAGENPELRPLIAENPNTYPELLQWLGELGDPEVDAALARRSAGTSSPSQVHPTTMLPAAGDRHRSNPETEEFSAVRGGRPQNPSPQPAEEFTGQTAPRSGYYPSVPTGPAPWQAPAAPASYAAAEPEPRRRGGGTCAIIFLILLIAAGAVVAAYLLFFEGVLGGDDPAAETAISEGQDQDGTADDGAQTPDDAEGDGTEVARPAPGDAQDIPAFTAPSGNINCILGEDELACSILDYSFETPQDCDGAARLSVGSQGPRLDCGSTEGEDSAILQYGQSASNGRFACVSAESGFECWNTETADGFSLARESYQLQD